MIDYLATIFPRTEEGLLVHMLATSIPSAARSGPANVQIRLSEVIVMVYDYPPLRCVYCITVYLVKTLTFI